MTDSISDDDTASLIEPNQPIQPDKVEDNGNLQQLIQKLVANIPCDQIAKYYANMKCMQSVHLLKNVNPVTRLQELMTN